MRQHDIFMPLRRRADFTRVHARGPRKGDALVQVRVLPHPASISVSAPVRLGIIVSKKFGSAVERNRFKRLVRAVMRELGPELRSGWDILVLPREAHGINMPAMLASFRHLLLALGVLQAPTAPGEEGSPT